MRKYILPESGNFYKANLHCHSTFSDGSLTPEQIKQIYMERGYSIVAYTDHNLFVRHNDLTDDKFLALNGYEVDVTDRSRHPEWFRKKTCHLCFVALTPDIEKQVIWHREKYCTKGALENKHLAKFDDTLPDYERVYSHDGVNDMIEKAKTGGFYVTYNHPTWSLEQYPDYIGYKGMHAMEIMNFSSFRMGYDEYNSHVYEDLLKAGNRIAAVAADDNHSPSIDDPMTDMCGGFVMIKAEKLEYRTITDAMLRGDYYASSGPEIKELYAEDGKIHVKTSPAQQIVLNYGCRAKSSAKAPSGETVTEAVFKLREDIAKTENEFFRITVRDTCGKIADTRAYFFDELNLFEE